MHLVHQYPPHFVGGTELYTLAVATAQAESGHEVSIFTPAPSEVAYEPGLPPSVVENGVRIYRVPTGARNRMQVFLQTFRQPQLRRSWRMVLETEQPDLVHIEHLMGIPFGFVEDLHKRSLPYVVTLHDYWYICANAQLLTNTEQKICAGPDTQALNCARCAVARARNKSASGVAPVLAPLMSRRNGQASTVLNQARRIIAPTKFVRDIYLPFVPGDSRIGVLAHGIDLPEKVIEQAHSERRIAQQNGHLHVGYIGSIAWQKGVHVLISAVNSLAEEDVSLTIYGNPTAFPEYTSELEDLIERPGINLSGPLDRDAIWSAIADFDVVVLPTLWYETSVLVIDEVNAMGVPVIGSDIGVMSEKIADGINGRLFTPGDATELRDIISGLIVAPEMLSEWRRNIEPVNDIDDHIRALEKIYASVLDPA